MTKPIFLAAFALSLIVTSVHADNSAPKSETIMAGTCGPIEGKESCVVTPAQAEISLTERRLLVITASLQLQDCEQGYYGSTCRPVGYPDSFMFMANSPDECASLGPVLALKKYKIAAAKGWHDNLSWRCE
jgi:hypothetical protein